MARHKDRRCQSKKVETRLSIWTRLYLSCIPRFIHPNELGPERSNGYLSGVINISNALVHLGRDAAEDSSDLHSSRDLMVTHLKLNTSPALLDSDSFDARCSDEVVVASFDGTQVYIRIIDDVRRQGRSPMTSSRRPCCPVEIGS